LQKNYDLRDLQFKSKLPMMEGMDVSINR